MNSLSDRYNALSLCYFGMTISMHDTVNISPVESYIRGTHRFHGLIMQISVNCVGFAEKAKR